MHVSFVFMPLLRGESTLIALLRQLVDSCLGSFVGSKFNQSTRAFPIQWVLRKTRS